MAVRRIKLKTVKGGGKLPGAKPRRILLPTVRLLRPLRLKTGKRR